MTVDPKLIERVYGYCKVEGECLVWQGSVQANGLTPGIHWQRKRRPVRRLMLEQHLGPPHRNQHATYVCREPLCVRLEHLAYRSRSTLRKRDHRQMDAGAKACRSARLSLVNRRIDNEMVRQIRESVEPQRATAKRFGVCQATVSTIRRGESRRDLGSPFAGLAP